jgi:hypothetical protein
MSSVIINEALKDIKSCDCVPKLNKVRKKYLGVSGVITRELLVIPKLDYGLRKSKSRSVLNLHKSFNAAYCKKKGELSGNISH